MSLLPVRRLLLRSGKCKFTINLMEEHAVVGLFGEALVSNRCNTYHTVWESVEIIVISDEGGFFCIVPRVIFWLVDMVVYSQWIGSTAISSSKTFLLEMKNRTVDS